MNTNKSFSTETSERYSRALFEVVKEANELEKTENDIKNFSSLLKKNITFKNQTGIKKKRLIKKFLSIFK
mgnify:CR=1 FL=1